MCMVYVYGLCVQKMCILYTHKNAQKPLWILAGKAPESVPHKESGLLSFLYRIYLPLLFLRIQIFNQFANEKAVLRNRKILLRFGAPPARSAPPGQRKHQQTRKQPHKRGCLLIGIYISKGAGIVPCYFVRRSFIACSASSRVAIWISAGVTITWANPFPASCWLSAHPKMLFSRKIAPRGL